MITFCCYLVVETSITKFFFPDNLYQAERMVMLMPEELMKSFLEELIESLEGTADAMRILLQYYHVSSEEEKCQNHIDKIRGDCHGTK